MKKALKIIHCANFSQTKNAAIFYSIDNKITNGLIRNGHFVHNFSYRDIARASSIFKSKKRGAKKMNTSLIQTVKNLMPDILLLGHSEIIYTDTLKEIKKLFPNIKIAMWWVDPLINIKHIYPRLEIIDTFFATTGVSKLLEVFGEKYKNKLFFMPNCCDSSMESVRAYEREDKEFDFIFLGRFDDERSKFIEFLQKELHEYKIGLFGNSKQSVVLGADFFDTLTDTKIGINFSRFNDIDLYSSDRMIQLLANGVFTLSPNIPNMKKLFTDEEIVYFENFDDFKEKALHYLQHPKQREEIAKKGFQKAHQEFNSTKVTKYMIEKALNLSSSCHYIWE